MITEISYRKSQRLQLQQFEPVEVEYMAKAQVSEGEDIQKAYTELKSVVNELVRQNIVSLRESKETKQELGF